MFKGKKVQRLFIRDLSMNLIVFKQNLNPLQLSNKPILNLNFFFYQGAREFINWVFKRGLGFFDLIIMVENVPEIILIYLSFFNLIPTMANKGPFLYACACACSFQFPCTFHCPCAFQNISCFKCNSIFQLWQGRGVL